MTADIQELLALLEAASGSALDARFDPWLADAIRSSWPDEVDHELRSGVAALPTGRREAVVFSPDGRVCWSYLPTCSSDAARRLAVKIAALDPIDSASPSGRHPIVRGLVGLGGPVAPIIAAALREPNCTRSGRRLLVAALARLDGEDALLRACLDDPDAVVRRLARDGFDRRRVALPPTARVPPQCLLARSLRASITDDERRAMDDYARAASTEAPVPVGAPLRAFMAVTDAWIDALRAGRRGPPLAAFELVMLLCLQRAGDDPLAPWCVADALCRVPPDDGIGPRDYAFLALSDAGVTAAADALSKVLSPEDAGNPLDLYTWLAARSPPVAPDAPAFARALVDPDPRIRSVGARATGRRRAT